MDNYANTPGPDKKSAKIIISNKLKKNKSNWNYVSEDDIENTVNEIINTIYRNKDENNCFGSDLGWIVSVEKNLYKHTVEKLNELKEKNQKEKK